MFPYFSWILCMFLLQVPLLALETSSSHNFKSFCEHYITTFSPRNQDQRYLLQKNWSLKDNGEAFLLAHYLQKDYLVFDVGANIGDWSKVAFKAEPNIHIFAFEPIPKASHTYSKKLQGYDTKLYQLALSNHQGVAEFYHCLDRPTYSSLFCRNIFSLRKMEKISVEMDTLDHFCDIHHISKIDYLKIDTEGGEVAILQGAKNLLSNHKITAMQFEYGGCYTDAKTTLKEAFQILTKAGYVIFRIIPGGLMYIPTWDNSLEDFQLCNYFAILQSELPNYSLTTGL